MKLSINPFLADIYLFKVNINNTRIMSEICSELTINTSERYQWYCSGIFIVNFEQISHIVQVVLLLTLNKQMPAGHVAKKKKKEIKNTHVSFVPWGKVFSEIETWTKTNDWMRNSSHEWNDLNILLTGFSIMLKYSALQHLSRSTLLIS